MTRFWRGVIVAIALYFVVVSLVDAIFPVSGGTTGMNGRADAGGKTILVTTVDPGGPADRAGIRVGDRLRVLDTVWARFHALARQPGDRVTLHLVRRGAERDVTLTVVALPQTSVSFVYEILRIALALVTLAIALRAPPSPQARALMIFFLTFAFGLGGVGDRLPWPVIAASAILANPLFFIGTWQALEFACTFPRPDARGARPLVQRIGRVLVIAILADFFYADIAVHWLGLIPPSPVLFAPVFGFFALTVLITVAFTVANNNAAAEERVRVRWISFSVAIGMSGFVALLACEMAQRTDWWLQALPLTTLAVPIGTTYALLRHRLLDIGFVVNRALVFGATSLVIVVAFGVVEWALNHVLVQYSHVTSWAEMALALGLGFALKPIHTRADALIDDVLFAARRRAVDALHTFTDEAPFLTDETTLRVRAVATVQSALDVGGAALLTFADDAVRVAPGTLDVDTVSIDDPALVRLRARGQLVDLPLAGSALPGALVVPAVVRGRVSGALVVGEKRSHEEFAPDEREALLRLAHAVAVAADALETQALRRDVLAYLSGAAGVNALHAALGVQPPGTPATS